MQQQSPIGPPPAAGWDRWLGDIYLRLLQHFGHRHWWPAESDFEMIVGAYLTQNVAWRNVELALANLRAAGLLAPAALAAAPLAQMADCIRPAGFFRQKAGRLQAFLTHLQQRYRGRLAELLARPWGELRAELLALPGIGPETADSILCYAARAPVMVMDAYTRRMFYRLGAFAEAELDYDSMQAFFHQLNWDAGRYGDFHAQIVALGKDFCRKRDPVCGQCPLRNVCRRQGVAAGVPAAQDLRQQHAAVPVRVLYRDQKTSTGRVRDGEIVLHISRRLPRKVQEEHVRLLVARLSARADAGPPLGLTPSPVADDAALAAWARELNQQLYQFPMGEVRFKRQQGRWGSCSWATRNIYISHRLRGGPAELLEYVLIHEICHLQGLRPPHGRGFWALVARALPDYQERRQRLRQYERWLGTQRENSP